METAVKAIPWWKEATKKQWYALFAGQAGWALDAFDVLLYVFALTTIMKEWGLSPAASGFLASTTLFASAFGGIAFGVIADRIGRKKALMLTVGIFSLCSGLSGLAQNLTQLAIARTLLGLGMGGQWASGALLVSETWPAKHRGKAIGFMQGGWAIGYIIAAVVAGLVLPAFGWRVLFFVGILPALLILWIQSNVEEPEIWLQNKKEAKESKTKEKSSFGQIFHADLIRFTLLATLVSTFVMFAYWGLFTWMPGFLSSPIEKGGAGLGLVRSSQWIVPMMVGAFFGYVSFGFFADRFGRRPTFAFFLVVSAALVYIYGNTRDATTLMLLGPFVGFFGSGYFSAFGAFISELFPTRARGAGVGFCYNVGRMMSAFAPTVVGYCAGLWGIGAALTITAFAFVAGAISIYTLPETKGAQLK
ncbi:MAG TPA: MFS transporter [Nitrospirota bacterium]|nr:MFS transporter [Nitrospirota bacterium]